jgi:predicted ATPase
MITHIRVQNFKAWQDSGKVELAPLTGFFGTNSSGKSSLLQMLLLLKQTAERPDSAEVIFFGNENSLVNLGNFREVIHEHKDEELLELEFGCQLQKPLTITTLQEIDKYMQRYEFAPLDIDSFTFDTAIRGNIGGVSINHFSYTVGPKEVEKIKWENGKLYHGNRQRGTVSVAKCYGPPKNGYVDFLLPLSTEFENLFNHVYPLGPTRVQSKRSYHWEGTDPDSVGQTGEDMIAALLNARVDQQTTLYEGKRVPIEERISAWLQETDLAYSFSIKRTNAQVDRDFDVLIQKGPNSAKVTLADMGYGLAQFLPVLVHCYYAPEDSTLILEQPGMHLHPKVQSQVADLLIEIVMERKLQILVESHSEHLLNRLQRRIAEEKINVDKTALYFCRNDEGVSTIEKLDMDELGNIKNWPPNFFGDEMGDLFAMTKAQRERQKRVGG